MNSTSTPQKIDLEIKAASLSIKELFESFYEVPDFQREYVWEPENVEKLLNDICDELIDDNGSYVKGAEYFIGSIVVYKDDRGIYQLIDGQQRTTTIFMILCILRDRLSGMDEVKQLIRQVRQNEETFQEETLYRVNLLYDDSAGALEHIANGTRDKLDTLPQSGSVKHLRSALREAEEYLTEKFGDDTQQWQQFLGLFTRKVKLIRVVTPSQTSALRVFETINNTGVGLDSMDLLKNLLFRKVKREQFDKVRDGWKQLTTSIEKAEKPLRFLRYFVHSRFDTKTPKPLREDELYDWIAKNSDPIGIDAKPIEFLNLLINNAEAYGNFAAAKDVAGGSNRYLSNIQKLSGQARQHFILLLAAQHLQPQLFNKLCKALENLIFCLILTKEAKALEVFCTKEALNVAAIGATDEAALDAFISTKMQPEVARRAQSFRDAVDRMYSWSVQKYRLRYIVAKLTQFVDEAAWSNSASSDLAPYLDRSVHIEHILPASPTDEIVEAFDVPEDYEIQCQRLGNLVLLEATINTSIQQDFFPAKCAAYLQSKFLLTRSVGEKPGVGNNTQLNRAVANLRTWKNWDSKTIDERQKMLTVLACQVWGVPEAVASPALQSPTEELAEVEAS